MNTIVFAGEHPKTFDVKWHTHKTWELVYCTSGEGAFRFEDGTEIRYQAGEVVLIPPRVAHANSSGDGFTNIHINIVESTLPYQTKLKTKDEDDKIKSAFIEARKYYTSNKINRELLLTALGELIVSYIVVFQSNVEPVSPVLQIRDNIIQNISNPDYKLDEYIHTFHFNYDYLRKLFKKEMGKSPLEYLIQLRMERAARLLETMSPDKRSIAEIARICGYENALYFSRVFKKYYGYSPSSCMKSKRLIHDTDPGRVELPAQK